MKRKSELYSVSESSLPMNGIHNNRDLSSSLLSPQIGRHVLYQSLQSFDSDGTNQSVLVLNHQSKLNKA